MKTVPVVTVLGVTHASGSWGVSFVPSPEELFMDFGDWQLK